MLQKAAKGLKKDGLIFVKENVCSGTCKEGFIVDNDDSSLTRSDAYMIKLFEQSNMQVGR
jgi:protein N-terminal methyltransferase